LSRGARDDRRQLPGSTGFGTFGAAPAIRARVIREAQPEKQGLASP
jgi:hypothetical protein